MVHDPLVFVVPSKLTHALAIPFCVFVASFDVDTALVAIISSSTIPLGKPPVETPVRVPDPFIVIGIIYMIVHVSPLSTVTTTLLLIVMGPADMALHAAPKVVPTV